MEQSNLEIYLENRIREYEEKLVLINSCRLKEIEKPLKKRCLRIIYLLHRDEALYNYCLTEFINIKKLYNEK